MKKHKLKKRYVAPKVEMLVVLLEDGICKGSITITPGKSDTSPQPQIMDWEHETNNGYYEY